MTYTIYANNKAYTVIDHAARRMLERFISEEMIIETLERGALIEQPHGTDLYEHQIYDEYAEDIRIIRVAVDEVTKEIKSVIDDSNGY